MRCSGLLLAVLLLGGAAALPGAANADDKKPEPKETSSKKDASKVEHGFLERVLNGFKYQVFIPYSYKGDKPYPTILFLHGSYAVGTDGDKMMYGSLAPVIKSKLKSFPFIAVFPQAHSKAQTWGASTADGRRAMATLAAVEKQFKVDPHRIYLTGYSSGGHGTWSLAAAHPTKWAAIAPVAGWGPFDPFSYGRPPEGRPDPEAVRRTKDIPCWCFYSKKDEGVLPAYTEHMLQELKKAGSHPKVTLYKDSSHGGMANRAYQEAELYSWLQRQRKK